MAKRFIVDDKDILKIKENIYKITGDEVNHIKVLRYNVGDEILINDFLCKIIQITRPHIIIEVIRKSEKKGESNKNITFFQAVLKSEKMDMVFQKQTELGIKYMSPFFSNNVVVKIDEKDRIKKINKYLKIVNEACKQCGRTDSVNIYDFLSFDKMIDNLSQFSYVFFAYEKERVSFKDRFDSIKDNINPDDTFAIVVGPEGGFDINESKRISELKNVITIGLGERILRAETAGIYITSVLNYELGN